MSCLTFTFLLPRSQKISQKRLFQLFIPKNSFSDQINPINDMKHDIPLFSHFSSQVDKKLKKRPK